MNAIQPRGNHNPTRILLATDGSEMSGVATELARSIGAPPCEIRVVSVIAEGPELFAGPWPAIAIVQTAEIERAVEAHLETVVAEAARRLTGPGRIIDTRILRGHPADEIAGEADRWGADLVVVGSRGHSSIGAVVLGSVSAELVDRSPAPVLVARGSRIDRILVATDGSACAADAVAYAGRSPLLAGRLFRVVSVARALPPWWTGVVPADRETATFELEAVAEVRAATDRIADEAQHRLAADGRRVERTVEFGDPAGRIIAAARDWEADLIVVGTRGQTGLRRFVLGSVARNVLGHASCSVLVTRPARARPRRHVTTGASVPRENRPLAPVG